MLFHPVYECVLWDHNSDMMRAAQNYHLYNRFGAGWTTPKSLLDIGTADMETILMQTGGTYTYTYDHVTMFFYGDHIYIGGKEFPIGQYRLSDTL